MLDLNDLYYFVQVVDHKGFTAASEALKVPKSNLSRRVQKLEQELGVRLIQRSSRRFVVTELGQAFYERCRAMSIEAEEAQNLVRRHVAEPAGRVRLSCPVALGQHVVADLVATFLARHPKVQVMTHLNTRAVDLIEEGYDLALRVHDKPLADSNLVQRVVCRISLILVASPAFLRRAGTPKRPEDLQRLPGISRDIYIDRADWTLRRGEAEQVIVPFRPVAASNDWLTMRKMANAGLGVTAVPAHVCKEEIAQGRLRRVLPDWTADQASLSLLSPSRRGTLPSVKALADHFIAELPRVLE
jgi:DNA-binding transcriptional LysR family regulator